MGCYLGNRKVKTQEWNRMELEVIEVQYRCGRKLEQFIYACVRKT